MHRQKNSTPWDEHNIRSKCDSEVEGDIRNASTYIYTTAAAAPVQVYEHKQ